MRKILLTTLMLIICLFVKAKTIDKIKFKNSTIVKIEVCSDNIFRIRISPNDTFKESLMERYGIIKTDWQKLKTKENNTNSKWSVSTGSYSVCIDKIKGIISVKDSSGNTLISDIRFINNNNPICTKLAKVINNKFSKLHVISNGGIIGDDSGSVSEKDKSESGNPNNSSIIRIKIENEERFYGGGSTSREHIQHRGELLRMWTTYQHTEIPMPFIMSSRGWGIFNNTTAKNFFDIGYTEKDIFNIYTTDKEVDFFLILGKDMPNILNGYTIITGRTYLLPKWAYGLCFGPNMLENQFNILSDAINFRQMGVPCDVFWLEPQWMEKRYDFSTKKKWNYDKFSPEPYWLKDKYPKKIYERLFIGKLRSMGFHLGLWLCEEYDLSIPEEDAIAAKEGRMQSGKEHWMDHLKNFLDYGVEGFKLDPARTIDEHTYRSYYNGYTDKEMHNLNQILLPKQMYMMTREHLGRRTWHHYTAGWSGTQHWTASTSGDNGGGKTALFDQLNLGMSGYMNTSCDVMAVEKKLEMQSLHFGMFLPWVQINSWFSMMHPFYYSDKEKEIYKAYVKLRYSLIPYIYSAAIEGALTGMPIVRSMPLMFPNDRNTDDIVYQYMFGNSFCVGIFSNEIYLPKGNWIDAWTGEKIESKGEILQRNYPENRAGLLFIKEGAIIPCMYKDIQYIGTDPVKQFLIKIYPGEKSEYTLYEDDGQSYEYEKGAIAATKFTCKRINRNIIFTINAVNGRFYGIPKARDYYLEIMSAIRPKGITINNIYTKDWNYSTDGKIKLCIKELALEDTSTIRITF